VSDTVGILYMLLISFSYANADQWQLEGVQPGGIRSGGIYGLWTHVDHDEHGPMGPFYYAPYDICRPSRS
jgi:hypothetical protein